MANTMTKSFPFFRAWGLAAALALLPAWAAAHEGHDDEAPGAAAGAEASPRFAAVSDAFELVGVLDGQRLSLYLDHAADNRPAKDARLDLEINGRPVAVTPKGEGQFEATLAGALPEGEVAVAAMVAAGADTDLLAGTLDVHAHAEGGAASSGPRWRALAPWIAGVVLALGLAVAWRRRAGAGRTGVIGGAA